MSASFTSTGSTGTGVPGDIALIRSTSGNITGSLNANGFISNVEALNGNIGVSFSPSPISARTGIRKIQARTVYANVTANNAGGNGSLWYLQTTNGPLVGSINAAAIISSAAEKGLDIAGNLDANINVAGVIQEKLVVDGSFVAGRTITVSANAITNQIIFNQANVNAAWNGNATVGSTSLSPKPYYDNAPSALGGGAIGLAPFMVHYEACNPVATGDPGTPLAPCTQHASVPSAVSKVSLTHYGPVGLWNGSQILNTNPPVGIEGFTVEIASKSACNVWTDVTDSFTTKWIGGTNRTIDIEGPFTNLGPCGDTKYFRIKPVRTLIAGQRYPLVCRDVDGNPLAGDYEFILAVQPPDCAPPGGGD